MAKTYTVKKGDCLWNIAQSQLGDPLRWTQIAELNGISKSNPVIYPGQVLNLEVGASPSSSAPKPNTSTMATIQYFGLQAGTDRTLFATWKWDRSHTENYKVRWWYCTADGIAMLGTETSVDFRQSTYNAPSNAVRAWFHVMPISKKYKSNDQDVSYWTADWSTQKTWDFANNPPTKPSAPSVDIKDFTLTAELDNLDVNGTAIEFQIIKDNSSIYQNGKASILFGHASYSCTVPAGSEYKVRCRSIRDEIYSDWSDYSINVGTPPSAPSVFTELKALSETSVYLEWGAVPNAESYSIEYTKKITYFDSSNQVQSMTVQSAVHHAEIEGLESGTEYFFRVRAVNSKGDSSWSEIRSIVVGKKPSAPTTWSSTTTAIVGEPLVLYWVHNSEDGSSQTYAELELTIDGKAEVKTIKNTEVEEEKDKTSFYSLSTSALAEGAKIQWRVRTAGITKQYGDWSIQREANVYSPPTLQLSITDINGNAVSTLGSFPFYVKAIPGPNTQTPIGYHLSVVSNAVYETVDAVGNVKMVNKGESVYLKYFDISETLLIELSANNIDLKNNVSYTVVCSVTMNSGLTTEQTSQFTVAWIEAAHTPNAEITVDKETLAAHIRPYCEEYPLLYYKVTHDASTGDYVKTPEVIAETEGVTTLDNAVTTTGELVYTYGVGAYFCMGVAEEGSPVAGISLSVYRREFDGSFTEIAKGLDNMKNTFVTDPHPALDYARYRIIATTDATGAVAYYDMPGYPVQEKAVIIQWDEAWSSFDNVGAEQQEQPAWSGSMLKLPYNIDVSDTNSPDVALVEYIGRRRPVSYYGTQIGDSSTWNVEIDKKDVDTVYALRRLAIYMGNVYVREPSGTGYWANIKVSFSQKHLAVTIPVTLSITRVEGGV